LAAQLDNTKRELTQLTALREDLRTKQRTYDTRLLQIPEVEREYSELTRDYGNAQTRYREIKAKQLQAEGAMELEMDSKAERFSLGEPANLPQVPFSPNRPAIAMMGLVASVGSGLGLALAREMFDPSVRSPPELARIARVPILTAIPYIYTTRDRTIRRRKILLQLGVYSLLGVLLLAGVHFFAKPLPALLAAVLQKLATL
jgi:polysaccharide biosynthesis transport protein